MREARNGSEAIALVGEVRSDLILLDFLMPDRDGIEVLRELRSLNATSQTPVVIYTAAASHLEELMKNPQVTRVLLKPLEATRLLAAVQELIGPAEVAV